MDIKKGMTLANLKKCMEILGFDGLAESSL